MARTYTSAVIPASADEVWRLVREFDGLPRWHPEVAASEIEGGGDARPGCVRALTLSDGALVRERLSALDDIQRSCTYEMLEGPFAVRRYVATLRLAPVTDRGHTFAEWYSEYDSEAADEASLDEKFGKDVYGAGFRALQRRYGA
ncbi:polyketide cyclase/dehydrase/lipid transport protein [Saccharopolyspora erythraea NRRL 2338]|uniref:Uncharacterized protein n=2 Tax=Saccharopolyspora erythraea TaxID=1836 RepID=A4FLF4_SACEN|nr:SRPBCC family protein [Saccharopolyspora erythraea]EQD81772.1 polyketide cyclase [Saccharopolyspora erythraea D]PFG98521.1 polyketide cyclase/dehydrase/lipid transport protein [Saccharopolyspora erythraea NRRL 2338]QRK88568.1 SRPBCC family protein [Saccharopolyspora erythraea]CAM04879.1 hypothetical protein SACE_5694 [Saccharopolyspora erythraea NRRL 2338]